ncbi:MAG: MFS transporter [Legionellales bacterium]|nr:MFS transporter [Legionellales bacterium]
MKNTATLWQQPEYLKFYTSFFLGNIGDWFDFFALQIIFAHTFNATANQLAFMLCAYLFPMMFLAPLAGSVADRFNKKWLLFFTDLLSGFFTLALMLASQMYLALIIICVRSCIIAFNSPAQQVMSKMLPPDELQLKASALEKISFQLCRIIGPMLGAVLVAISSPEACLAINAVSFFISSAILFWLKPLSNSIHSEQSLENVNQEIGEKNFKLTWRLIKKSQLLSYFLPLTLIGFLVVMMVELQLVILLREIIPSRPNLLGYVIGCSAIGSVLSGLWLSRKQVVTQFGGYTVLCYLCVALGYSVMGVYRTQWPIELFLVASLLSGIGLGIIFVLQAYAIKKEIPSDAMGRFFGILSFLQGIIYGAGVAFGGSLITAVGARDAFLGVGIMCLVLAVIAMGLSSKLYSTANN